MRRIVLPLLLAAALLAVPIAMAAGGEAGRAKGAAHRDAAGPANDENATAAREERAAERASFHENRTTLLESFRGSMLALRESWHENATKIRDGCRALPFDAENATKEQRVERAHCIRDGYSAWHAERRAEMKELREELRALLAALKDGRKASS